MLDEYDLNMLEVILSTYIADSMEKPNSIEDFIDILKKEDFEIIRKEKRND